MMWINKVQLFNFVLWSAFWSVRLSGWSGMAEDQPLQSESLLRNSSFSFGNFFTLMISVMTLTAPVLTIRSTQEGITHVIIEIWDKFFFMKKRLVSRPGYVFTVFRGAREQEIKFSCVIEGIPQFYESLQFYLLICFFFTQFRDEAPPTVLLSVFCSAYPLNACNQ